MSDGVGLLDASTVSASHRKLGGSSALHILRPSSAVDEFLPISSTASFGLPSRLTVQFEGR